MATGTTMASFEKGPSTVGKIHYFDMVKLRQGNSITKIGKGGSGDQLGPNGKLKGSAFGGRNQLAPREMPVFDGRPNLADWSIDTHGFMVAHHKTQLTPSMDTLFEEDEAEIRRVYWPEIEALVMRSVCLADGRLPKYAFGLRTQKFSEERDRGFLASYSRQAHTDFSDIIFNGAHKMLTKRGVSEEEASSLDLMIINTWQPLMRPAYKDPLTLLDWTSVDPKDFAEVTRDKETKKAADGKAFAYGCQLTHNPNHRWVYLSNMTTEEVWLSKQADSRLDGKQSRYAFHTSFSDPKADPNLPGRRSIAVNVICGFERPAAAKL